MKWEELDENKHLGLTLRSPSILEYGDDATADDLLFPGDLNVQKLIQNDSTITKTPFYPHILQWSQLV